MCTLHVDGLEVDIAPLFVHLADLSLIGKKHVLKITGLCGFPQTMSRRTHVCKLLIRDFLRVLVEEDSYMLKDIVLEIAQGVEDVLEQERLAWAKKRQVPHGASDVHFCKLDSGSMDSHEMARFASGGTYPWIDHVRRCSLLYMFAVHSA